MIRALMGKELRQLLPLILALMALETFGVAQLLMQQPLDELTWAEMSVLLDPFTSQGVASLLLALAVLAAYMLYPREHDEGSIGFLYSLPVRPQTVFAVKVCAAALVLLVTNTLDYLVILWMQSQNTSSISGTQLTVSFWLLEWAMVSGFLMIGLGYGLLISFFRRFGILVAALGLGLFSLLAEIDPSLDHLALTSLLTLDFDGQRPILEGKAWLMHGLAAIACTVLARSLWLTRAEAFTAFNLRARQRTLVRVMSGLFVALGAMAVTGMIVTQSWNTAQQDILEEAASSDILTERYHFRYVDADRTGALALSKTADASYDALSRLLHTEVSSRIVADLTEQSSEHLGIAGWQKLRIERGILDDPLLRAHVLNHETVHVLAASASRRRLGEHGEDGQFFVEGLAEWAAHQILDYPESREGLLDLAAAAWQRFDLRFDDMLSRSAFVARHDEWLTYALGYAWMEALAATCGVDAPGEAVRAMGREDTPKDLSGRRFWQQILQLIGCDLSAVNARFALAMSEHTVSPAGIPRVRGGPFNVSDELLVFEVSLEPVDPGRTYRVAVRVRDSADTGRLSVVQRSAEIESGQPTLIYVPNNGLSGESFQYQLGVAFAKDQPMYFEQWQEAGL